MTPRLPRLAAAMLVGSLTFGIAAPAMAQDETTESEAEAEHTFNLKARCQAAIERRLSDLGTAQSRLDNVRALTDAHEATLDGIIDSTEAGLARLSDEIKHEDDRLQVVRLCTRIATDFRVYLVVLPQAHLTVGADRVDAAVRHGRGLIDRFDEAVEVAIAAGADVDAAVALRNQTAAHLDNAESSNSGVAAGALNVTPQSYNDGPGEVVLDTVRGALREAHSQLKEAHADGRAAVQALRDAIDALP